MAVCLAYCRACLTDIEAGTIPPVPVHITPIQPTPTNPCIRCGARRFEPSNSTEVPHADA